MVKNFDVKIKNATVKDFVNRCDEMSEEILPMLQAKGYISNFKLTPLGMWTSGKTEYLLGVTLDEKDGSAPVEIPIDFRERDGFLYLHDDYETEKDYVYNDNNSLFEALRQVVETFKDMEYYETISNLCSRNMNIFDNEKERTTFLTDSSTQIMSMCTKSSGKGLDGNEERDEEERE